MAGKNFGRFQRTLTAERVILSLLLVLGCLANAQNNKNAPAKADVTGHYEGTAKNNAGETITVAFDLTEKEGALSGMIRSSHGDFAITGGSHKGEDVKIEFDANGGAGTILVKANSDKLAGTWSAGDDGGAVDVRKVAAQEGGAKGKL